MANLSFTYLMNATMLNPLIYLFSGSLDIKFLGTHWAQFCENWLILVLCTYFAWSCRIFVKILSRKSRDIRLYNSGLNWDETASRKDILGKVTNVTFLNLFWFINPKYFKKILKVSHEIWDSTMLDYIGPKIIASCKSRFFWKID